MPAVSINGARLHYEETGEGDAVVFIHGTGAHSPAAWERCIEELPRTRRLITYDRRGFGRSRGKLARSLGEHVDDAAALLRKLDAVPATIVSQSGGGVIALRLQARHPELVSAMVMTEPAYQVPRHPSAGVSFAMAKTLYRWLVRRDPGEAALGYYRWATGLQSGGNSFDGYPEAWKRAGIEHAQASLREILHLMPLSPPTREVRRISCPVTLLIGDLGVPVFQRTTRRLHALVPHAQLVSISDTSHLISTDQPRRTAAAIASAIGMDGVTGDRASPD